MPFLLIILLGLPFQASWSQSRCSIAGYQVSSQLQAGKRLVTEIVENHQSRVFAKFGRRVKVNFHFNHCDAFQMSAGVTAAGELSMDVHSGAIKNFSESALLAATCHELGHFLGAVTLSDAGETNVLKRGLSVEGEADYFAGACVREFFGDRDLAEKSIRSMLNALYKSLDLATAEQEVFRGGSGINPRYPSGPCRLLSALAGIEGSPRPQCWYNPN